MHVGDSVKALLLHTAAKEIGDNRGAIYLNCEDFKRHSFPNVLIEILDSILGSFSANYSGWFGRKKKIKTSIKTLIEELNAIKNRPDEQVSDVSSENSQKESEKLETSAGLKKTSWSITNVLRISSERHRAMQQRYQERFVKIEKLYLLLPKIKRAITEYFETSNRVESIHLQIDDLYHLKREDQAFVADYVHRMCKDTPLYFKFATLRHVSSLFVEVNSQPIGAQERHDYQPINLDYSFANFDKTREQNREILRKFGERAGMPSSDVDGLFKGQGFDRLVMAGGGVPRDFLSLFIEALSAVSSASEGDGRIGKDDVRILSRQNFENRIEELKYDCNDEE